MSTRRWIRRLYDLPLHMRRPLIDLWVGGPGADGRGLDAINGGVNPAPGLQITSPSSSTPSSSARVLIRAADGTWRDKQAGVLAGIGGRVWTGSGWTYQGAGNVTFLGPLPALSTHGVTDTVRRYQGGSGRTVQDAPGGIVQPYSQRVDVAAGQSGDDWPVAPVEIVSSIAGNPHVYWHGIVESDDLSKFVPMFGAHNGVSFFDGSFVVPNGLAVESEGVNGLFAWQIKHRGIGPNGGLVAEYFVRQLITQNALNVELRAYLLRTANSSQGRTLWIHQHAAHHWPANTGKIYEMPTFVLVANGAEAALVREDFVFGGAQTNVTLVARMDLRKYDFTAEGYRVFAYAVNAGYTPLHIAWQAYAAYPPVGVYGNVVADLVTLAVAIGADRVCYGYRDGVYQNAVPLSAPAGTDPGYRIGRYPSADARTLLTPYRRLLVFPRVLSGAEISAVHQSIVAAEGGL